MFSFTSLAKIYRHIRNSRCPPWRSTVPSMMNSPCGWWRRSGAKISMGRNDPSDALMASTSVLPIEMPSALTPWPNITAPNPQVKPVTIAITSGAVRRGSKGQQ